MRLCCGDATVSCPESPVLEEALRPVSHPKVSQRAGAFLLSYSTSAFRVGVACDSGALDTMTPRGTTAFPLKDRVADACVLTWRLGRCSAGPTRSRTSTPSAKHKDGAMLLVAMRLALAAVVERSGWALEAYWSPSPASPGRAHCQEPLAPLLVDGTAQRTSTTADHNNCIIVMLHTCVQPLVV
jgi:hypothetical protein